MLTQPTFLPPPLPLRPSPTRPLRHLSTRRPQPSVARRRLARMQSSSEPPDFAAGFAPELDTDYEEVRVLSFGPARTDGSLLTLRPVRGGEHAFKMSVTHAQADSIRAAIERQRRRRAGGAGMGQSGAGRGRGKCDDGAFVVRPSTHDLFKDVMDAFGGFVTKAAITHIQDEVFIARVWIRGALNCPVDEVHIDSRPSDAIAMALRSRAPLYLNKHLMKQWHISVDAITRDAKHGLCECVHEYPDEVKSTRSIVHEMKGSPEHITLAKLKMELDLAVRLERFAEAIAIREQISSICPIDTLAENLQEALAEERYLDAAKLQDQITLWKARMRMWEKGNMSLDEFKDGPEGGLS